MRTRVAVVGGGLAGLFTAVELIAAGVEDLVVFEASDLPGGIARTHLRHGYRLEPAVGSMTLPHPQLSRVLEHLSASVEPAAAPASTRFVWTGGRLVEIPASPAALAAPIAGVRQKLRAALEPLVAVPPDSDDESLEQFMRRRLGHGMGRIAAWLMASGVFAGDPAALEARASFPRLAALESDHGSLVRGAVHALRSRPAGPRPATYLPTGDMASLAQAAAARLGDRFRAASRVTGVAGDHDGWNVREVVADHLVLACDPGHAAGLIGPGALADLLGGRPPAAPVAVVWLGGTVDGMPLPTGFGILTGPDAATSTRGILLESSYAPHRAPTGHSLVKVIAGGHPHPEVVDEPDERLVQRIGGEVARILGADLEASMAHVVRHVPGIPQYTRGHTRWLQALDVETPSTLHLTGWAYRGVGMSHLAADAARIAGAIAG